MTEGQIIGCATSVARIVEEAQGGVGHRDDRLILEEVRAKEDGAALFRQEKVRRRIVVDGVVEDASDVHTCRWSTVLMIGHGIES